MGFLSGVLGAVKNENEVTTYDNYIEGEQNKLNKVLEEVTKNIGSGRTGLVESVAEVKRWLNNYLLELGKRTSRVTGNLGRLKDEIAGKYTHDVAGAAGEKLEIQLAKWKETLQSIEQDVNNTENQYVNVLDSTLKRDVMREIKVIRGSVTMLKESAGKEDLKRQAVYVDTTLADEKERVVKNIKDKCNDMRNMFNRTFDNIWTEVNKITGLKKHHFEQFSDLVTNIMGVAEKELGHSGYNFRNKILSCFHTIKHKLNDLNKTENSAGALDDKSLLKREVDIISEQLTSVGEELHGYLQGLSSKIAEAHGTMDGALMKVQTILAEVSDPEDAMQTNNKKQIKSAAGEITVHTSKLYDKVTELKKNYDEFYEKLKAPNEQGGVIIDVKIKAKGKVAGTLKTFESGDFDLKQHLDSYTKQIRNAIEEYVNKIFGKVMAAAGVAEPDSSGKGGPGVDKLKEIEVCKNFINELNGSHRNIARMVEYTLDAVKDDPRFSIWKSANSTSNEFLKSISTDMEKEIHTEQVKSRLGQLLQGAVRKGIDKLQADVTKTIDDISQKSLIMRGISKLLVDANMSKTAILEKAGIVTDKLTGLCDAVTAQANTKNGLHNTLTTFKEEVIDKSQTHDTSFGGLYKKLETLQQEQLSTKPEGRIRTAIHNVIVTVQELENTPSLVTSKIEETLKLLNELKDDLIHRMNYISHTMKEADNALTTALIVLSDTLSHSEEDIKTTISHIESQLLLTVTETFRKVGRQVKILFSKGHLAHLSALKTLLTTQLKIITCAINKNLNTGLKGFLKTLSGDHIDPYLAGYEERPKHPPVKKEQKSNLLDPVKTALDGDGQHGEKVRALTQNSQAYFLHIFDYLHKDLKQAFASQPRVFGQYEKTVSTIQRNLTALLDHISTHKHFDHQVPQMLETLKTSLTSFKSSRFGNASYPVLDAFPQSLVRFVGELERMYVSKYEGEEWVDYHSEKYSKVGFSVISILNSALCELNTKCDYPCQKDKINEYTELGGIMRKCGFGISTTATKQDGELKNKDECTGSHILEKLGRVTASATHNTNLIQKLDSLNQHLHDYYRLCHIAYPSKRQPCSVYEMLIWLSGLRCNPVYDELLLNGLSVPFEDPEKETKEAGEDFEFTVVDPQSLYLNAYPKEISYNHVVASLEYICSNAYDLLSTILGTGNTYTLYAVDYCTNALNLRYPSAGDDCLHSILDILRRMFPVLRFMHVQCMIGAAQHGWSDCRYGRDIPSAKRPCIDHITDKAKNQSDCLPTYPASGQPTCQPNCQPNSPLMSYLNDCLPGHLPHQLTAIGCKTECSTCKKATPGMPCLTPLGFRGFSGTSKTGKDICSVLDKFFDDIHLSSLFSLVPKPPSTLPEHFNFALSLVTCNNSTKHVDNKRRLTFGDKFGATIIDTSINLYDQSTKLTEALRNAYGIVQSSHTGDHNSYELTSLASLSMKKSCVYPNRNIHCGPYIQSLWNDSYTYLSEKHADHYLSWALYLPWTLYDYLRRLLQDFQNISCRDWGCSRCQHGDKCKPGKHGVDYNCKCRSLVGCRGVQSTFYRYGFTFGNSMTLLETNGIRYCRDFCNQLTNVLKSEHFKTLFTRCDEFLFKIREPFIWLNVALWSLSVFYLLCVMVGRLDVLHIRSHLRSPSSHRITAQSLLAAAQVGRLAKISYLQP